MNPQGIIPPMPGLPKGRSAAIRARFGPWLDAILRENAITKAALAEALYLRADPDAEMPVGERRRYDLPRSQISRFCKGKTAPTPETAFSIGEALRDLDVRWCSGLAALYAAGYLADFIGVIDAFDSEAPEVAPLLAALVVAAVGAPKLVWRQGIPELARHTLKSIWAEPGFHARAWERWCEYRSLRGFYPLLFAAYAVACEPDLEDEAIAVLYKWAERTADNEWSTAVVRPLRADYEAAIAARDETWAFSIAGSGEVDAGVAAAVDALLGSSPSPIRTLRKRSRQRAI